MLTNVTEKSLSHSHCVRRHHHAENVCTNPIRRFYLCLFNAFILSLEIGVYLQIHKFVVCMFLCFQNRSNQVCCLRLESKERKKKISFQLESFIWRHLLILTSRVQFQCKLVSINISLFFSLFTCALKTSICKYVLWTKTNRYAQKK